MAKEEKIEAWLRKVPNAEHLKPHRKQEVYTKVSVKLILVFLVIFIATFAFISSPVELHLTTDLVDFLCNIIGGINYDNDYIVWIVVGVLQLSVTYLFIWLCYSALRRKWLQTETEKALAHQRELERHLTDVERYGAAQVAVEGDSFNAFWSLETGEYEQEGFTMRDIECRLDALKAGKSDYLDLIPEQPVSMRGQIVCNRLTVTKGFSPNFFIVEMKIKDGARPGHLFVYEKGNVLEKKLMQMLQNIHDNNRVPDIRGWKLLSDTDLEEGVDVDAYKQLVELLPGHEVFLPKIEACLASPQEYYKAHEAAFNAREIDDSAIDDDIVWQAIADEMCASGYAVELDLKEEKEEFVRQMNVLAAPHAVEVKQEWLADDGDVPAWCAVVDEKWAQQELCIAAFDIDSGSYVLFVCAAKTLERLIELSDDFCFGIDFGKNMQES